MSKTTHLSKWLLTQEFEYPLKLHSKILIDWNGSINQSDFTLLYHQPNKYLFMNAKAVAMQRLLSDLCFQKDMIMSLLLPWNKRLLIDLYVWYIPSRVLFSPKMLQNVFLLERWLWIYNEVNLLRMHFGLCTNVCVHFSFYNLLVSSVSRASSFLLFFMRTWSIWTMLNCQMTRSVKAFQRYDIKVEYMVFCECCLGRLTQILQ